MIDGKFMIQLGFKPGKILGETMKVINSINLDHDSKIVMLKKFLLNPLDMVNTELGSIALLTIPKLEINFKVNLVDKKPYTIYGKDNIEKGAFDQMDLASMLPISVLGSLMPDSHQGYGLPIGGVLATNNAIIPYGVGVDIGCRMALTIYDINPSYLEGMKDKLSKVLVENTRFGTGCEFENPIEHEVLENQLFDEIKLIKDLKTRAAKQIGTSGSGNHFVEFGIVELTNNDIAPIGKYIGILSHSGSRGFGARIADYYTKVAIQSCILPKEAKHLAYLSLDSEAGQEYWLAMNLAGEYAKACHDQIHKRLSKALGWKEVAKIENHHNFAWKETYNNQELIVHRKGATPAGKGVLGIIPGSMATTGFIIKGKGNVDSLNSAAHGAGRAMSRTKALNTFTKSALKKILKDNNVTLIGGALDEAPMAYKDIHTVMSEQKDLVDIQGTFTPRIVRMDDSDGGDI
jgi:tRNA-splicing ligase RtcB